MKTNIEILEDIIHSHKSSLFLRHSTATRKDVRVLAELLYKEVVDPYMAAKNVESLKEAVVTIKSIMAEEHTHSNGGVTVMNYVQEEFPFK